jgi:hypothetical protein
MTDKQKLEALLTELGIEFKSDQKAVVCEQGMVKVKGYQMFFTQFSFDQDGKFTEMGAYE